MLPDFKIDPNKGKTPDNRSDDSSQRPTGAPERDYKQVAREVDEREGKQGDDSAQVDPKKKKEKATVSKRGDDDEKQTLSLFDLAQLTQNKKLGERDARDEPQVNFEVDEKKEKRTFFQAHDDLAEVNPFMHTQNTVNAAALAKADVPQPVRRALHDLIDQIVAKLYTIEKNGVVDTVIELNHPPLFKGAQLIVHANEHASREFNLTFGNLSLEAKKVLDMMQNQASLRDALEQRGYGVHIVITSTERENVARGAEAQPNRDQQFSGQDQNEQQQKDKDEDESSSS